MARVRRLTREDLPPEHRHLFDTDEADPTDVVNPLHRALANNPALLSAWAEWVWALYGEFDDARRRELLVLGAARATDCAFVWDAHVDIALAEGLTREEVLAVATGDLDGFDAVDAALVSYATAQASGAVTDAVHADLAAHLTDGEIVAAAVLVGEYVRICSVVDALAVSLPGTFVGWDLAGA